MNSDVNPATTPAVATASYHSVNFLFRLWFPICVPEQLKPDPIQIAVPDFSIEGFPKFEGVSDTEASWPQRFLSCKEAVLSIFFPGIQTGTANKPWIEKASGEKYVETRAIRMECTIPQSLMDDARTMTVSRGEVLDVGIRHSAVHSFAESVLHRLLDSFRWRTGQHWIGQQPNMLGIDFESVWTDPSGRRPLGGSGNATDRPDWEGSRPLGETEWKQADADLRTLDQPALHEMFLWDAKHAMRADDVIRTVLYAAIAVEIFTKRLYSKQGGSKDPIYNWVTEHDADFRTPFVEYYDSLAKCLCGRSLKDEHPETFRWLGRLFQTRNKIMHEGRGYFRAASGQQTHNVDWFHMYEMLNAANAAIKWLEQASGSSRGDEVRANG